MTAHHTYISADDYSKLIISIYGNASKKDIAESLGITRATHDARLKDGGRVASAAQDLKTQAKTAIESLNTRAAYLKQWT